MGGRLPERDVTIDESSGSTGTPYNWVRSGLERHQSHIFISYFAQYCYGTQPYVTINAFSMGAWATGINMGVAMARHGIVKCTGPDVEKILHTLRFFGPSYRYLIAGYPPFLKHLIDAAEAQRFPFEEFDLRALVGGEGMAEGLRDYLLRRFRSVFSGFGATDLEIGIAGETPVAVAIRRLCRERPDVRTALFGADSRLPMLFQYNPLMHYVEVNENRELLFTISRQSLLSPRVRYNVHDEGGVARFDDMQRRLAACGIDIDRPDCGGARLRLPFFWIYGRRDYTVSVMGANIYPEDIEQCLYADAALAKITHSFCLALERRSTRLREPQVHLRGRRRAHRRTRRELPRLDPEEPHRAECRLPRGLAGVPADRHPGHRTAPAGQRALRPGCRPDQAGAPAEARLRSAPCTVTSLLRAPAGTWR